MFKKTMQFEDLEGNDRVETFYFNFTKLEIVKMMEFDQLEAKVERLTADADEKGLTTVENTQEAYLIFEDLTAKAYGIKGADGVTFSKSPEIEANWRNHSAFPELIFELLGDTDLASQFFENCLPKKALAQAKAELEKSQAEKPTAEDIRGLVETAAERQANPETAIAPGVPPQHATEQEVETAKNLSAGLNDSEKIDGKTDAEIMIIADQDPTKLTGAQLQRAFYIKSRP